MKDKHSTTNIRGYIEGYYGKLFSWQERTGLLQSLASHNLNTYCYAPKEDPQHRFKWREAHSGEWHQAFGKLCSDAESTSVSIVAGIAPGLDFDHATDTDFGHLQSKAKRYLDNGATNILLLWDDIDDDFTADIDLSEGTAHARTVNQLSDVLNQPVWTVPRVYAAEIENKDNYLEDFFTELQSQHTVLICGNAIVASKIQQSDILHLSRTASHTCDNPENLKHRTVIWDNFYANDYCPRRLFIGPWTGREEVDNYLVNPTGMPYTDKLIMDIVTATHTIKHKESAWFEALKQNGVPEAFLHIAPYFLHPCFGDKIVQSEIETPETSTTPKLAQAIEHCLWKWKSPLAREWYPFIMSLKHDIAIAQGTLPSDRILKTQPTNLSTHLMKDL